MAVSWSPDNKSIFTSAADRTVKLCLSLFLAFLFQITHSHTHSPEGDAQTQKAVTTWTVGSEISHQQVGNAWSGESNLVSLSLSGTLNIFDPRVGDKPPRILEVSFSHFCLIFHQHDIIKGSTKIDQRNDARHKYIPSRN